MKFRVSLCLALVATFAIFAADASAQFTQEQRKVYDDLLEAQELNDVRAMERIASRNTEEVEGIFDVLEGQMAYSDSIDGWEEVKLLAGILDQAKGGNAWTLRMQFVSKMSLDQRQKRADLRSQYGGLMNSLAQASKDRNKVALKELTDSMVSLADEFAKVGDPEYEAYSVVILANALKDNDQQLDAVKLYDRADQVFTRAGYQNHRYHGEVKAIRDSLKKQGYDPDAKPGEQTGPAGNTSTSWAKDAEGKRYSEPIPMKLVIDEKIASKFSTPSWRATDRTGRWWRSTLSGNKPMSFASIFKPMGKKLKMHRKGATKFFYQLEGSEDWEEFKVISKPSLIKMKTEVSGVRGTSELTYAWLSACGSNQESWFGMSLNLSPQPDRINIRWRSACYLKGKVLGENLLIFDDNSSGSFGDPDGRIDPTNALRAEYMDGDAMMFGRQKTAGPYSEFIEANGAFYRMKIQEDYSIRTRKLDVDTAKVKLKYKGKVKPSVAVIEERKEFLGAYFAVNEKTWTTVPVGEYRFSYGIIRKGKGNSEQVCRILPGRVTSFRLEKDQEYVLELGAPFTFDFKTEQLSSGAVKVIGNTVVVYGDAGELYSAFFDQPAIPDKVSMRVKGGGSAGKPVSMERAGIDEFNQDNYSCYTPNDLTLKGSSGKSYEVKMELKKHPLLNAPIKSDWK